MARRRSTPFEDLVTILARLPWWACLAIALASWLFFKSIAGSPIQTPSTVTPDDLGGLVAGQMLRSLAIGLQYVIPFACVLAAIGSVITRARRRKLLSDVQAATQPGQAIDGLSWRQFEQLVGEAFRRQGYSITETGGNGPDGGVDLILRKDGEKHLVQCKHWRALKVGVAVIREFFGAMAVEGAAGGFVVTSGKFTGEAQAFAEGRNIKLVDGEGLKRWLGLVRDQARSQASLAQALVGPVSPTADPVCPRCNSAMVQRTAKRGANAGKVFYGCVQYPRCHGVVNI